MNTKDHRTISIAEQIFEQLEKDILSGKYQRGEVISEGKLSQELGVSRTPVREAVMRLLQDHVLMETSKGLTVVGITKQDIRDMYEIRTEIEGRAGAMAAANITDEELEELGRVLDLQRYYVEKGDPREYADNIKDLDTQFHALLYRASRSMAYIDVLIPMHMKMTKFRKASVSKKSRAVESISEHQEIYDALKKHDTELTRVKVLKHTANARDRSLALPEV